MKNILRIDASMRMQGSYGRALLDDVINQFNPTSVSVKHRDLAESVPLVNEAWIGANFADASERTSEQRSVLSFSDALVEELRDADTLVIATPIYNFHVPAAFKAWIDLVVRARETFKYTENGPIGLLENKRAIIVITSGGTKLGSNIDFVSDYLRHVFSFIGINDVEIIDASAMGSEAENILSQARQQISELIL